MSTNEIISMKYIYIFTCIITLTYVAEITQPRLRGILSSTSGVAVILGILVQFLLGSFLPWRTVALLSTSVPCLSFILLFFVPESPYWLLLKRRTEEAQAAVAWLRGWVGPEEVKDEFNVLNSQISTITETKLTMTQKWRLFTKKNFYWPFGIVTFAFFLSQFCGTTPVQVFAVQIFAALNSPINEYYATVGLGVAEVLGCVFSTALVHWTGKRSMNFFSLLSCGLCFMVVAVYTFLNNITGLEGSRGPAGATFTWIPMTFIIAAALCSHTGIKLLPWMLLGEVYSNEIRATASGVTGAVSYFFSFFSIKIFLYLVSWLTLAGTFWFYCAICCLGAITLYFILPETEGKTLFDITEHFARRKQLDNRVTRIKDMNNGVANAGYVKEEDTKL